MKTLFIALIFLVGIANAQYTQTATYTKNAKDTTMAKTGITVLYSVVLNKGTADTLFIYDSPSTTVSAGTLKMTIIPASHTGFVDFARGVYFRYGLMIILRGTTAGTYNFIYE